MARATGGDLFLKLMTEVTELKATSARQEGAMGAMQQSINAVQRAVGELQRNVVVLAENARLTTHQLERIGTTLLEVAEDTSGRLTDHEARIAALEAKGGR